MFAAFVILGLLGLLIWPGIEPFMLRLLRRLRKIGR
jgi:hypothetical protein